MKEFIEWDVLTENAHYGDAYFQGFLGREYYFGSSSCMKNLKKARYWFEKAIEQDDAIGLWGMAQCNLNGDAGIPCDYQKAIELCNKSIEKGCTDAYRLMGTIYAKGLGLKQSGAEACKWFLLAANNSDERAEYELGLIYRHPEIIEDYFVINSLTDAYKTSMDWLIKSSKNGCSEAQALVAYDYMTGSYAFIKDDEKALYWLIKSAEQGNVDAQYKLAEHLTKHKFSQNESDDYSESIIWYYKAAMSGHVYSQKVLARIYELGSEDENGRTVVRKNLERSFFWITRSAKQGDELAQFEVAHSYSQGFRVEQNYYEAYKWYMKAAKKITLLHSTMLVSFLKKGKELSRIIRERYIGTKNQLISLTKMRFMLLVAFMRME